MNHYEIDAAAVAQSMLERGFAQLLAPEALDDSPAPAARESQNESSSGHSVPDGDAPSGTSSLRLAALASLASLAL